MMATGTKGLTLWCKNITKHYGDEIEIHNMNSSWKNGLAFCAILHHYRPDLIDFGKLSKENVAENNALAFRVAEDELGIPALLDVEDMVNMRVPDRLSIMTYVSQYYNYFKDKIPGEIVTHRIPSKKRPNTENIESSPVGPSPGKLTIRNASQMSQPSGTNLCFSCGKTVYLMERLSVEGKLFHRVCFKCLVCGTQLKTSTYEFDRTQQKFFCEKDFKERGKKRDDPDGKENTPEKESPPLSAVDNDVSSPSPSKVPDMTDDASPSIDSSPFKRNEQFVRKGIRPHSSPVDVQWEKAHVIKSKEEEIKSPTKPSSKTFFSGLLRKKTQSVGEHEFANPSYQQHIDLSNFMNQLDSKEKVVSGERVVIGSENAEEPVNDVNNVKSPKKKKFVLKVKKKKATHKKEEEESGEKVVEAAERKDENKTTNYENLEVLGRVYDVKPDSSTESNPFISNETTEEERHYAEPSSVGVPVQKNISALDSNIYLNVSNEINETEDNNNPLLLAARNRLRSSGRRQERNIAKEQVEGSSSNQYLAVRGNLKKTKSAENVNDDPHAHESKNTDRVGQTFLAARAKLHKTGIHTSDETDYHGDDDKEESKSTDQKFVGAVGSSEELEHDISDNISDIIASQHNHKVEGESLQEEGTISQKQQTEVVVSDDENDNRIDTTSNDHNVQTSPNMARESPDMDWEESSNVAGQLLNNCESTNTDGESPNKYEKLADHATSGEEVISDTVPTGGSLNPFLTPESSPRLPRKSENTNPFLSSNEDLLFEGGDESDEFDQSNPFAEDVRLEKQETTKSQNSSVEKASVNRKKKLREMGIDETNPFADDFEEEMDEEGYTHSKLQKSESVHVPTVVSHMPVNTSGKKLVLKTKPKKRSAPEPPPQAKVAANTSPTKPRQGTFKKRQAPQRPTILEKSEQTEGGGFVTENTTPVYEVDPAKLQSGEGRISGAGNSVQESPPQKSDTEKSMAESSNSTPKSVRAPFQKRASEKRKAPARPLQPDYEIDEEMLLKSVALRDKQPNREEMEKELELLEVRQRELEMEGVMMEKKLRGCDNEEPEEAYLLTWFELVNQKNLLLRRENELIYLCQEQDFLRNQRRAEFELRQLMNKPEGEKTLEDRMREDKLLADILNYVTRRSNIIDQMDEDRLREYEEDLEISNMMVAQGLSSPSQVSKKEVGSIETSNVKKKDKKKKEKNKKKKSVS